MSLYRMVAKAMYSDNVRFAGPGPVMCTVTVVVPRCGLSLHYAEPDVRDIGDVAAT
jgi:hypothetical protein